MTNIIFIIIGILLLQFIIIGHEWGHYITAKFFGVKVNEFALGMGPKLFSFQRGETVFSLRLLPVGGFCSVEGEDKESENPRAFKAAKPWKRMIICSGGVIMNFICGFLISLVVFAQSESFVSNKISKFSENSISQSQGLMVGDEILKIDDISVLSSKDIAFAFSFLKKTSFNFEVKRKGEKILLENVNLPIIENIDGTKSATIDFHLEKISKNFFTVIGQTFLDMLSTIKIVWLSIIGIITGKISLKSTSGPIGIVSVIGEATAVGLKTSLMSGINNLLSILAMISINLGMFNLIPLPALDGGAILLCVPEMITGKRINEKYEFGLIIVSIVLIVLLALFTAYNDIIKLMGLA